MCFSYWGVFWIDASTRENAEAGYASLGQALGRGATFPAGKHWLSQCDRSWLLVIDNADDPELDISEVLPIKGAGHILITTRNPNVVERATAGIFRFRGMDPEEGISLLLKSAFPSEQADASKPEKRRLASSIAAELGYLAIALDQAGATIRRKIYTLERYLHFYLGHRHRLLQSPKSVSPVETNVIATWEIPFKRIENHVSIEHHDAVDLLHVFAFLHFESIPERMFRIFWTSVICDESNNVLLPEILRLDSSRLEEAQTRFRRAAGILYDYSVIEYDPDQGLCSLHPVVHRWARSRLPDDTKILHWLECTLCILTGCISPYLETSGRSFRRSLLPHIESCFLILESYGLSSPQNQQRAKQMERFASVYAENGLWKPAIKLAQAVVRYRVKSLGKSNNETLRAQRSISQFYWNLFEVKSTIDIQKQILFTRWWSRPSLSAWSLPFKPEYDSYLIALDDLTQSLWLAGARDWSKKTGERAVNGFFKQLGPEDPRTLNAMFNLGRTYCHLGEFEKGHELLVMVLKKRKRFFGIDHPDTLMTRNELGMSFCARKQRLAIAERLVVNVLEARKRVLGEEHAYTLWSINDWSKVLCERGRPLQAAKLLEDLIPVVVRTLGEKHIGMTMTKANLARAYVLCEKWADAESILRVILSTVSDDHPDWIHTLSGLVHVQINLGRWDEAEKNCDQMLDHIKIKKTLEVDNPRTIAIAEQLARVYASTGRLDRVPALKAQFPAMDTEDFKRSFAILPSRSKPEVRS